MRSPASSQGPTREEPSTTGALRDDLEVVEHAHAGGGFERAAAQDSFAMDEPPSEEVKVDPRFARAMNGIEPATELLDREMLQALATDLREDTLKGEELADALGQLPVGMQHDQHSDPETLRINGAALAAKLLELTVPTPLADSERGDNEFSEAIDLTLPTPIRPSSSRTSVPQYPPSPAASPSSVDSVRSVVTHQAATAPSAPQAHAPQARNAPAHTPSGAAPRSRTGAHDLSAFRAPTLDPVALELPPPEPRSPEDAQPDDAQPEVLQRALAPRTIADEPTATAGNSSLAGAVRRADYEETVRRNDREESVRPIDASDVARAREARAAEASQASQASEVPLPLVGLVVAGSGGLVAVLGTGLVATVVTALVVWLARGPAETEPADPLPPIEFQAPATPQPEVVPAPPVQEPDPGDETSERTPSSRTRRPVAPPPAPEPILVPVPAVVVPEPPEEVPDFEELPPRPEPEKRGLFGKKKKD